MDSLLFTFSLAGCMPLFILFSFELKVDQISGNWEEKNINTDQSFMELPDSLKKKAIIN